MKNEGAYQWVDGTNITVKSNWENGEPNTPYNNENCVELRNNAKWNDHYCLRLNGFLCERRLNNDKK